MLAVLDEFEGVPTWYNRQSIQVKTVDAGRETGSASIVTCDCYIFNNAKDELLSLPYISAYRKESSNECTYIYKGK